ncbi:MAG: DNRLRE domain-containing protein [Anaerolineae bacterium]|nr:DNRLRE domain-containing protein [Anaerolineae bacterium]
MIAQVDGMPRLERRRWASVLVLLFLIGVLCLGGMLLAQTMTSARLARFIPVNLHSKLEADYQVNPNPPRLARVGWGLIWDTIFDHERNPANLPARQATLLNSLQTPIPLATPQVCQGTHLIYAAQDTWVDSANPAMNYGADPILQLGRNRDQLKRILLYFPLDKDIFLGAFIYSARLEMNVAGGAGIDPPELYFSNLVEPFQETTLTWSNQPEGQFAYRPFPVTRADVHAWDVTDMVQLWLLERYPNHGLVLEAQAAQDFSRFYYSRETDQQTPGVNTLNRVSPRLLIDCGGLPPQPVAMAGTPSPTPTNIPSLELSQTPPPLATTTPPAPPPSLSPTALPPTPILPLATATPTSPSPAPPATEVSPSPTSPPPTDEPRPTDEPDPTSTPTPIPPRVDLVLGKTDSPDPVSVGNNLTYVLNVTNNGPSNATGVAVADTLPAGVTLVSTTPSQGSCMGVSCNLGSIASGASASVTIVVTVGSEAPANLTNTATVSADQTDPNPGNNTATTSTTVNVQTDLSITKTDNPDPVVAGQPLTYTLTIVNNGPSNATGVTVSDTLPPGVTFSSAPGCSEAAGTVTCNIGNLAASSSVQRTIVVMVGLAAASPLTNQATVTGNEADPNNANNSASITTDVTYPAVDLAIAKSVDNSTPDEGEVVVYTLTASNAGPDTATNVVVTDVLPAGVTYVADDGGGAYNSGSGVWTVGTLTNGANAALAITATVNSGTLNTTIVNTAVITTADQVDSNPGNNTASVTLTVLPSLSIVGSILPEGDSGPTTFVFTVTLSTVSGQPVTVNYATADGTATLADNDYVSLSGPLTFPAGTTIQTITVQVNGDTTDESDETFLVNLSGPSNATLSDSQGTGLIINDDSSCSSTVTFVAGEDTWFMVSAPNTNQEGDSNLKVHPDTSQGMHSVMRYDLSSISSGATLCSATLLLYEKDRNTDQTIYIHRLTTNWSAATATWNSPWTSPGGDYVSPEAASFTPDVDGDIKSVDITSLAQYWVDNPGSNFGLLLRSSTTGDNGDVQFKSLEDGTDPPRLIVQY